MKFITKYQSPNYNKRASHSSIKFIIIHYTAMINLKDTIAHLCNPKSKVSAHFLITKKGLIYKLVDENYRAWHAGKSNWKKIRDLNSYSIGIELENSGHLLNFEKYSGQQISALIKLLKYLKKTYNISKLNILGHSDISPLRKIDPGQKFPWIKLEKNNLVYLPKIRNKKNIQINSLNFIEYKKKLRKIGYFVGKGGKFDKKTIASTKAFQMHYQQKFVTGQPNKETFFLLNQFNKDIVD